MSSPVVLVVTVTIGTCSNNPMFCLRSHLACRKGRFHVQGFQDVYISSRGGKTHLTSGRSSHVAPMNRILHGLRLSRLPRLFGIFVNSVSLMNPHPRQSIVVRRCRRRVPRFRCHLGMGTKLANCTRMCNGCGAAPCSGLGLSLFCVRGCSFLLSVGLLFVAMGVFFRGRISRNISSGRGGTLGSSRSGGWMAGQGTYRTTTSRPSTRFISERSKNYFCKGTINFHDSTHVWQKGVC